MDILVSIFFAQKSACDSSVPKTLSEPPPKSPKNDTGIEVGQFFGLNDPIPHFLFPVTPSPIWLRTLVFQSITSCDSLESRHVMASMTFFHRNNTSTNPDFL